MGKIAMEMKTPEGLKIEAYLANPVLLWAHDHGRVIGRVSDVKQIGDAIAEVEFELTSEAAMTLAPLLGRELLHCEPAYDDEPRLLEISLCPHLAAPMADML